jgi:hypothetical protein
MPLSTKRIGEMRPCSVNRSMPNDLLYKAKSYAWQSRLLVDGKQQWDMVGGRWSECVVWRGQPLCESTEKICLIIRES